MNGLFSATWLFANQFFPHYKRELIRVLSKKRKNAKESDDATTIGGLTVDGLLAQARADLAAHAARRDNPHSEGMWSIGSYNASTIDDILTRKIANSILPISTYGIVDELTDEQVNLSWGSNGFNLICSRAITTILSGTPYNMQPVTIPLATIEAPAGKTFYIYVRSQFGQVSYQARTDSPPESVSVMFIGTVKCGSDRIISTNFKTVTRIETFRLSGVPLGSVMPVTDGDYDHVVPLPASWNPL